MQEIILFALLLAEIAIFSFVGTNFATASNAYNIIRLNVELGLLALAMTPVIVTGGIDLSVGSLMGLTAVLFGKMWRDAHLPIPIAAAGALGVGVLAGLLNALLITRLKIPPLIVTLGSFSLFRGIAEGITGGTDNFTNFPWSFVRLGQGYLGPIPVQLPIFLIALVGFWILLQRTTIGRELCAIGFAPQGARHAGIPVEKRIALVYVLCSFCSALAAIIYVAHFGQAKADAGTGYELLAITAVVLGGTSIFGGRGSILGTLLGLTAIGVLQDGLQMADRPAELAGVLTGVLLLVAASLDRLPFKRGATAAVSQKPSEELDMKNSQLGVLCLVILAAALIVTGGNFMLLNGLKQDLKSGGTASATTGSSTAEPASPHQYTIALMPKSKGNSFFITVKNGADAAAKELNVNLLYDGPADADAAKQNDIIDTWIARGVDAIAVTCVNSDAISDSLRRAQAKGIKVVTYDSDSAPDARSFFVNQATPQGIGYTLMDNAARILGNKGEMAIITGHLTAANLNEWRKYVVERQQAKYPDIKIDTVLPCDDNQSKATDDANNILNAYPNVRVIMAICSPAVPGSAEAVQQAQNEGRAKDVKVLGLGLPNENKKYVHAGITDCVILWNTFDLGYLTIYTADDLLTGKLKPGMTKLDFGKLKGLEIKGDNVLLGQPFTFTKDNIDQFDF
jgi:rhamnose transport system permease protein